MKAGVIALALGALASASASETGPEQALLLPMPQLMHRLGGDDGWCLMPLERYRGLVASARAAEAELPSGASAYVESARLTGRLVAVPGGSDRVLRVSGTLTLVSLADGAVRCHVFGRPPDQFDAEPSLAAEGARTNDPAVWVPAAQPPQGAAGIDAIVTHRGRSTVAVSWSMHFAAADDQFVGGLVVPLAGSLDLEITSDERGWIAGDGIFATAAGWSVTQARAEALQLAWHPGDAPRGAAGAVFGLAQRIDVALDAGLAFRWQAHVEPRLGEPPTRLRVTLPPGWHAGAPSAGIARVAEAEGALSIEPAALARDLALDGWLDADAAIDLPRVEGAAYQGGVISLTLPPGAAAWRSPPSWRAIAGEHAARAFAVPAPGDPMRWRTAHAPGEDGVAVTARVAVGAERWRIDERATLRCAADRLRVPLRLPAGWSLASLSAHVADHAPRTVDADAVTVDGSVTIELGEAAHPRDEVTIDAMLERSGDVAWSGAPTVVVDGVADASYRVDLAAAPGIDVRIDAAGWRAGDASAPGMRASLLAVGAPPPIALRAMPRGWDGEAQAVLAILARAQDARARLDLRLRAREAELGSLLLAAPFAAEAPVSASDGAQVAREGDRWRITFAAPWRGERTVRLEGRLADRDAPRVALAAPLTQLVLLQATDDVDVHWTQPTDAVATDLDALPAWAAPFPQAPVVEAVRLTAEGGAVGALAVTPRPLAGSAAAFVDALTIDAQIEAAGTRLLARGRLCAPGLAAVALSPPPGMRLLLATIDGERVGVRRDGDGWSLPLPGRTQVEVAALFAGDAPPATLALGPPRFGALPTTRIAWTVAVAGDLAARSVGPLRLAPEDVATRAPWGGWTRARERRDASPAATTAPTPTEARDPRLLRGVDRVVERAEHDAASDATPTLALVGARWTGIHRGDPCPVTLELARLDALAWTDSLGRLIGLAAAIAAAALLRPRAQALLAAAAACVMVACLAAQRPCGPLLGACETLAPLLVVWQLVRRLPPRLLVACFLVAACARAEEASETNDPDPLARHGVCNEVLMGYQALGLGGAPQGVVVALTRERLDELTRLAKREGAGSAPAGIALGALRVRLRLTGDVVEGEASLPVRTLTRTSQSLTVAAAGTLRSVRFVSSDGGADPAVSWQDAKPDVVATLPGERGGRLEWSFALPTLPLADGGRFDVRFPPALAGTLSVSVPDGVEIAVDGVVTPDRAADGDRATWTAALPPGAAHTTVSWRRHAVAVAAGAPRATQDVQATLAAGRVEWSDRITIATRGAPLAGARLRVPAGMTVTAAESARLAHWRQDGEIVELTWTTPQANGATAALAGVLPRAAGAGGAALAARLDGGEDGGGRVALHHGDGMRFALSDGAERTDARAGEDLAARWHDAADAAATWTPAPQALSTRTRVELVAGRDRVRAVVSVMLAGVGEADALSLRVPPPWRIASDAVAALVVTGDGRAVELRQARPWTAGMQAHLTLDADRADAVDADGAVALPGLETVGAVADERQTWIVGDAGDRRAVLEAATAVRELPLAEAAPIAPLAPGEAWRQAFERRPGEALPRLRLVREAADVAVDADHYLIAGPVRVRWLARLTHRPQRDELRTLTCSLPQRAEIVRVAAPGLGGWRRDGDRLRVDLGAPTRRPVALELELDLPLGELPAIAVEAPARIDQQRVALVERDRSSYLRIDADGLAPIAADALAGGVPAGVDAALVRRAWRAERLDWRLTLTPQATAVESGPDGVAALADISVAYAADGSLRGRAVWQVLERTRRQIPLRLPPGGELWELRVDGRAVRAHRDPARPDLALVPMRAPRCGEGSVPVAVIWRQGADAALAGGGTATVRAPELVDVRVVETAITACAPAGWTVERDDGTMRPATRAQLAALRAHRIADELVRVRALDPETLGEGAQRVADRLDALDVELGDHLAALSEDPAQRAEAAAARASLREERQRLDRELAAATERRAKLGLDAAALAWETPPVAVSPLDTVLAAPLPWAQTEPSQAQPLGAGQAPAGTRDEAVAALGVELFPPLDGAIASFAQPGQEWSLRLRIAPPRPAPLPWLAAAAGVVLALAAVRWARR